MEGVRAGPSAESVRSASSSRKSSLPAPMLELRAALAEMGSDAKQLQLHELVGKGGFGSVYRGTWRGLNVRLPCSCPLSHVRHLILCT